MAMQCLQFLICRYFKVNCYLLYVNIYLFIYSIYLFISYTYLLLLTSNGMMIDES